ncbi:duf636 domain protein [Moniliophthora roreri MCA 2997]|uniref:Duf636 domain protein n=2 Tax=Moniliophthora roreri TaxID=221103 RepID=V2YN98_MONRO|nr:duf636 domain protein [Moniliophthora roreri MCA 2997]
MPNYTGSCYCREIQYEITLDSPDQGRTSICHCHNCKKFFGNPFGTTTKIPKSAFKITSGTTKEHVSDNGSTQLHREFCGTCGSGILEYGQEAAPEWRYIMYGTLDERGQEELAPKGEFFGKYRNQWMPEIPDLFHKEEIKQ